MVSLALPKLPSKLLETTSDILQALSDIQRALLCFMVLVFREPNALYKVCLSRGKSEYLQWKKVQTFYVEHIEAAATLSDMYLILDEILNTVYWRRMVRNSRAVGST